MSLPAALEVAAPGEVGEFLGNPEVDLDFLYGDGLVRGLHDGDGLDV